MKEKKIVLIGIGNCGRRDDGLGWAFLDAIQDEQSIAKAELVYCYQLNVEDAELISTADVVVFIDAYQGELKNGCSFETCQPENNFSFTTHSLSPGVIVSLCSSLYNKQAMNYVLKIQGEEWELKEGLSKKAEHNLSSAIHEFKTDWIKRLAELQVEH